MSHSSMPQVKMWNILTNKKDLMWMRRINTLLMMNMCGKTAIMRIVKTTVTWTGDGWKRDVGPGSSDGRAPDM